MEHLLGAESWCAFSDIHTKMEELKGRIGNIGRLRLRSRLRIRPGKQLSLGLAFQMHEKQTKKRVQMLFLEKLQDKISGRGKLSLLLPVA